MKCLFDGFLVSKISEAIVMNDKIEILTSAENKQLLIIPLFY